MMATPDNRKISMVRIYLAALPDDPNGKRGTLQAVGREHDIPLRTLRRFRDGTDSALPALLVNSWAKLLGNDADITGYGDVSPIDRDWYTRTILSRDGSRLDRYLQYEIIDDTRPEASSALDAWADIVVTGGIGDVGRRGFAFDPEVMGGSRLKAAVRAIGDKINSQLLPDDQKMMLVRDMSKYGDQWEQIGLGVGPDGGLGIAQLVNMPVKTMWTKTDRTGRISPNDAFAQILPGQTQPVASWPAWKIVQFSNRKSRASIYGTSIFQSGLRSYIQIEAMEAAMIIRRLERAPLRMKHVMDVGHLASEEEIRKAKADYRARNRKVQTVSGNRNFQMQRISMPADEDYIVAKRDKDSPADIVPVEGDANIGQIADYIHFFNKWLSGLGPPKAHLGYEADTMRSVVTDLHIVFARKGRRMQMQFIHGLAHLYYVEMILAGIDPRKVNLTILPPALGTRDELIRAQVLSTHSETVAKLAKAFAQTGKVPTIEWFLRYVMGLDDATMDAMELCDVVLTSAGSLDNPANQGTQPNRGEAIEMAGAVMRDEDLVAEISKTQYLLQERAIGLRKPEAMGLAWPRLSNPFGDHFDDVVRSLGKTELKVIE